MSEGLFNPEAFEQMPGQMSMEAVESTFTALAPPSSDCALCHGRGFLLPAGAGCGACHGRGVIDRGEQR